MTDGTAGAWRARGSADGRRHRGLGVALLVLLGGAAMGCSLDGLLDTGQLPTDVQDPALTQTPQGARAAYAGALEQFGLVFGEWPRTGGNVAFISQTGVLTDELVGLYDLQVMDRRTLPEGAAGPEGAYSELQTMRGQAAQAIGLLTHYVPEDSALVSHLYALQGYAEVFLAELFCSGIPLSTVDYDGDYTYQPGSSTEAVFTHAIALFDTALTLAGDSARFGDLARLGRGRALLALGRYADAAAAVAGVADAYHYDVYYRQKINGTDAGVNFARAVDNWYFTVPDREGFNGLDWRSSGDPRTRISLRGASSSPYYHPDKYAQDGSTPIVLASGVEARLIAAEAALQADDVATWLAGLNTLRTDGTQDGGGVYNPGTGGVAGLAPLADPGASLADPVAAKHVRVDLLFRERAFWLFLTGHRQGDLRRLIRQYGRTQDQVYPVGAYSSGFSYGADVTAPIPTSEYANPLYTGCASRGA